MRHRSSSAAITSDRGDPGAAALPRRYVAQGFFLAQTCLCLVCVRRRGVCGCACARACVRA
eukprot:7890154-Alexandrium_andersonii.AAC.1